MKEDSSKKRLIFLDILNILAIVAVLFMHHDFGVHYFRTDKGWFLDLALKIIMYFCIPVFLMCTGSTLLGYKKKYGTKTFFKKRLLKILVPMIAWFVIVGIFRTFIFKNLTIEANTPIDFINYMMQGGILDYYWYLFLIIGIYLTIPILAPLAEEKNKSLLKYAIMAIFIFNMVIPQVAFMFGIHWNADLLAKVIDYIFYPLVGYYISAYNIEKKKNRVMLYMTGIVSIIFQFIMITILSYQANEAVTTLLGYTQFTTAIYATAIFCLVRNLKPRFFDNSKLQKILKMLAGCSFGVYLTHYIVMYYEKTALGGVDDGSKIWRFICPFLTYILCVGLVLILKKIPFVKKIVP